MSGARFDGQCCKGIDPVDGWSLWTFEYWDEDGFTSPSYFARKGDEDCLLNVSRFSFSPSQERFAYLVRNGFPKCPSIGPWNDADLDRMMVGGDRA